MTSGVAVKTATRLKVAPPPYRYQPTPSSAPSISPSSPLSITVPSFPPSLSFGKKVLGAFAAVGIEFRLLPHHSVSPTSPTSSSSSSRESQIESRDSQRFAGAVHHHIAQWDDAERERETSIVNINSFSGKVHYRITRNPRATRESRGATRNRISKRKRP